MSVPATAKTLVVQAINYTEAQVSIGAKTTFAIQLEDNSSQLDEVVVVGYGTQKKSTLVGAVSQIKKQAQFFGRSPLGR